MNYPIPDRWVDCTKEQFEAALATMDYVRDGRPNGITYYRRHDKMPFGFDYENGKYKIEPVLLGPC